MKTNRVLNHWGWWLCCLILSAVLLSCSGGTTPPPKRREPPTRREPPKVETTDVRVKIPAKAPGMLDFVTPEVVIKPGEEKMYCLYVEYKGEEVAANGLKAMQGKFGHHIAMLKTKRVRPNNTLEDCSDDKSMEAVTPWILPLTLPEGHGIRMPKGSKFVVQFHYVNSSTKPILVRDVARIKTIKVEQVKHWVSVFNTNSLKVNIPSGKTAKESFDCEVYKDITLLFIGGHMHEYGTRMQFLYGPSVKELKSLYLVAPWLVDFRDTPPTTLFFTKPKLIKKGTILRTICQWKNTSKKDLKFPAEMCSMFGLIRGTEKGFFCEAQPE